MKIHERFEVSSSLSLRDILERHAGKLNVIVDAAHLTIAGGPKWKEEYTTNEQLFCEEMLTKLLQRMGFKDIQYRHGSREFGKDFTFTEVTSIGPRYYALQAKAGNISGSVQGDMDIILGQMEDAFTIPYRYPPGTGEHRFISAFIIAISGKFTNNAEEKIRWKLLKMGRMGVVYLWDRQKILEMIHRLWLSENNSRDVNAWEVRMEFLRNS
ncbi:MAG: hypothetical protein KatS3mg050_1088 [Litorilinea sp.]|nr:MAG: hypothetical protein KatS3mg050_1088 [Litorilinea sp.]